MNIIQYLNDSNFKPDDIYIINYLTKNYNKLATIKQINIIRYRFSKKLIFYNIDTINLNLI